MKPNRSGLHELLYYGEAAGVLIAWLLGVAVLLSADKVPEPVAEGEAVTNILLSTTEPESSD